MVQVQSSCFPLVDLNPQRFENIPEAKESDFESATERIYHTAAAPSGLEVTILPATTRFVSAQDGQGAVGLRQ